ncbi:MAG: hypothetical protein AB2L16_09480 [Anaerolineaceae bacterium]|jgi:hypothetical protein
MKIIVEGSLEGSFHGFNGGQVFKFTNGQIWEQAEYKYHYHYAYRPTAQIIEENGIHYLQVNGMSDHVKVKKVR